MSSTIPSGETETIPSPETRTFDSPLQVSGTLQVSGKAVVTNVEQPIFGKSRADGEKNLIVRAEGEKNLIARAEGEID